VQGEEKEKVSNRLNEPELIHEQDEIVVAGVDSAK
jgi:hypothetical protein